MGPQHLRALDHARGEAREVEVAGRVEAGHLGGLPAGQAATDGLAGRGDRADDHARLVRVEAPDRQVVEEDQRPRPGAGEVVDAHGHQVLAQPLEPAELAGQQELGAHPVGAGDQHRLAHAGRQRVRRGEAGLARHQGGQRVGVAARRLEIDPRVAVGERLGHGRAAPRAQTPAGSRAQGSNRSFRDESGTGIG